MTTASYHTMEDFAGGKVPHHYAKAELTAPTMIFKQKIDKVARAKAEINRLEKIVKELEPDLKALGVGEFESDSYVATITESERSTVDTERVKAIFGDDCPMKKSTVVSIRFVRKPANGLGFVEGNTRNERQGH